MEERLKTHMHLMAYFEEANVAATVLGSEFSRSFHVHVHRSELLVGETCVLYYWVYQLD